MHNGNQIADNNNDAHRTEHSRSKRKLNQAIRRLNILSFVFAIVTIVLVTSLLVCLVVIAFKGSGAETSGEWPQPSISPLGQYSRAAVASHHGFCSEIGRDILLLGGNAVDAAIAVEICVGVMNPHSSGIGGGLFMNIYNRTSGVCQIIDARETAPAAATADMFVQQANLSTVGYKSVAVPGAIHGLWTAYQRFGSGNVRWSELLQPSIDILRVGVPISPAVAEVLYHDKVLPFVSDPDTGLQSFINPETNDLYKSGELMRRPEFLETLTRLANANNPVFEFYRSSLTEHIVLEMQNGGGIITRADMANYESIIRDQSTVIYANLPNGLRVCGPPPPSSSAVTIALLKSVSGIPQETSEINRYQKLIESMKFAYADRSRLGDMDFVKDALQIALNQTSDSTVSRVVDRVTSKAQPLAYYNADFVSVTPDHGTSHMSVLDAGGNAVSWTSTINLRFGSKRISPSSGIVWNNEMDDFSTPNQVNDFDYAPSKQNYIQAGKRPMSSMSPIIVYDSNNKRVRLVVGAAGGSRIISTTAQIAMRALYMGENIKQAIDAPRLHNQLIPQHTKYEPDFPKRLLSELRDRGQTMHKYELMGVASAIHTTDNNTGLIYANADYRKGSTSYTAGY